MLSDVNAAANSLSVLDSKLSSLYQKYRQLPYDIYEPGFAADPAGYEYRNAFQARHPATASLKTGPAGKQLNHGDGGYHTRTIPAYHHDPGGYETQNAFHPHYPTTHEGYNTKTIGYATKNAFQPHYLTKEHHRDPVKEGYNTETTGYETKNAFKPHHYPTKEHPVDEGYNTKTVGYATKNAFKPHYSTKEHKYPVESTGFPLYQEYQHAYYAEPSGYGTSNAAFRPYRSGSDQHHAAESPGKYLTDDGPYHTRTGTPLYHQDYLRHPTDHGGYATQNVYRPYLHSGVKVGDEEAGTSRSRYVEALQDENTSADYGHYFNHDDDAGENNYDVNYGREHYVNNYSNDDDDDEDLSATSATTDYEVIYPADIRPTNVIDT